MKAPVDPPLGRILLGRLGDEAADEVVLTVKRIGASQRLELHCHGGRTNIRLRLELLAARRSAPCSWQEFIQRTDPDPIRAAAAVALANAPTIRTAAILFDQYNGAFAAARDAILTALACNDIGAALAGRRRCARHALASGGS